MSRDEYVQFLELRTLRGHDPLADTKQLESAKHRVYEGYYLGARPPVRRMYLDDPAYPRDDDRLRFQEDSLKNLVFNVLLWHVRSSLFQVIADLLADPAQGHSRFILCEAVRKADRKRAPDVLMSLLEDPDVGAFAMVELGKLKFSGVIPYAEIFSRHPVDWVRREAEKIIRRIGGFSLRDTRPQFEEVLSAAERALGARLVVGENEAPQEIKGKVSAFVIGSLAEDERGWSQEHCACRTFELDDLEKSIGTIARRFKGDLGGEAWRTLLNEILQAEHEDWKAYKLKVLIGGRMEEIWIHYYVDDPTTIELSLWGPREFIAALNSLLPEE